MPFLLKALQVYFSNFITKGKKSLDVTSGWSPKKEAPTEEVAEAAYPDENWERVESSLSLVRVCGQLE